MIRRKKLKKFALYQNWKPGKIWANYERGYSLTYRKEYVKPGSKIQFAKGGMGGIMEYGIALNAGYKYVRAIIFTRPTQLKLVNIPHGYIMSIDSAYEVSHCQGRWKDLKTLLEAIDAGMCNASGRTTRAIKETLKMINKEGRK